MTDRPRVEPVAGVSWHLPARVLVTGASGDIGRAITRRLAEHGVDVVATDLRPSGHSVAGRWVTADLTTREGRKAIVAAVEGEIGGLVHAAGLLDRAEWDQVPEEDFDRIFAVNVKAPFLLVRALRAQLARDASVVLIGSIAGLRGSPGTAAYAASKAALRNLGATLGLALAPEGVRVNVLSPGLIDTALTDDLNRRIAAAEGRTEAVVARERQAMIPLDRLGTVEDVADGCLYLLSAGSRFVTGATLSMTGGVLAGST